MGIPAGAVQNALKKEGKDTSIIDMDPEKSYASQVNGKGHEKEDSDPPLREDPQFSKYFKVSRFGVCFSIHELHHSQLTCIICLCVDA